MSEERPYIAGETASDPDLRCYQCGDLMERERETAPFCSEACDEANERGETPWRCRCIDCRRDTVAAGHYYMVDDELWARAAGDAQAGMLCLDCLERRIGRRVEDADFRNAKNGKPRAWRLPSGRWADLT
jgi:hypothetical protein